MKIALIILNYRQYGHLSDCLSTVLRLKTKNFVLQTIIVDNQSNKTILDKFKIHFPKFNFISTQENLGYVKGNNLGINYALKQGADYFFIINNDTLLHPDCLNNLVKFALNNKNGGVFGPKIYFAEKSETHKEKYKKEDLGKIIWFAGGKIDWNNMLVSHIGVDEVDTGQYDRLIKTDFITGCAMFIKREVIEKIGIFDEKYYLYYEDVDLSLRIAQMHYEIYFVPNSIVWHKNAISSGGTGSDLQIYYMTRNRLLIGKRYASLKTKLALFRESIKLMFTGSKTQQQAVKDFFWCKYGKRK